MSQIKGLKVMITIVDRKKGDEVVALFEEIGYKQLECALHHVKGDVKQDILDILNGKRDIQMSPIYSKS